MYNLALTPTPFDEAETFVEAFRGRMQESWNGRLQVLPEDIVVWGRFLNS